MKETYFCVNDKMAPAESPERVEIEKQEALMISVDIDGIELLQEYINICRRAYKNRSDPDKKYFLITLYGESEPDD